MELIDCLSGFTIGKVLAETSGLDEPPESVRAAVSAVSPETHPSLARAMADGYQFAPDEEFKRGIRAMVSGWSKASAPTGPHEP